MQRSGHDPVRAPHPVARPGLSPATVARFAHAAGHPPAAGAGQDDGQWSAAVDLRLDDEALSPVVTGHAALRAARRAGAVYGLTTGVGALRHVAVADPGGETEGREPPGAPAPMSDEEAPGHVGVRPHGTHTLRLWRSHAAGLGPELDDATARAAMLIRLHQLLRGSSGVDPSLVRALGEALAAGAVPSLRPLGAIGTADLSGLAQLGLTLVGELPWRTGGVAPAEVVDGDGLPFLSSNAVTAAVGSLAVRRLVGLAHAAEAVAALSHLALNGAPEAYDARVHAGKDDPEAAEVAARMRHLLGLDAGTTPRGHSRIQDPFSLRALPQVHAPLVSALGAADRALAAEIGAAAENPLLVDVSALHHGQFHTQRLSAALDATRAATYAVLGLSVARTSALLNPDLTGLRAFLAAGPADSSGLMIVEYVAADLLARARGLTLPTSTGHAVVSLGLEEHASFSTQGAGATDALSRMVSELIGVELLTAVRALRSAPERLVDCPARELYDAADAALPDIDVDHVLGPGLRSAAQVVRDHSDALADR